MRRSVHYNNIRNQRLKKRRRLRLLTSLGLILLFCTYSIIVFNKDTPNSSSRGSSPQQSHTKDIEFTWPVSGYAAIGSVEGGLLARSSDNEGSYPIASIAKVIAALAIMKKQPLDLGQEGRSYTLTAKDIANYHTELARGGSVLPVRTGMTLTQYQAMQAMLITSSNNIAEILTERVFGSKEAYISYAQDMLHHMGLSRTVVVDASGFNPATVSTPSELVTIGIAALKNPVIAEIVAQPEAWIPDVGIIKNTNKLLGSEGVVGLKTGTTDEAGNCLLFAARYAARSRQITTIVGAIVGETSFTNLFDDTKKLLMSARQDLDLIEAQPESQTAVPPPKHNGQVSIYN